MNAAMFTAILLACWAMALGTLCRVINRKEIVDGGVKRNEK